MAGRPSNRDERYEQVMQALLRCVARLGIDGATLSAIAKESGLTRPLIRHHLGNRDDILQSLKDYVLTSFDNQTEAMTAALPEDAPATALVNILFSEAGSEEPELVLAFAALTARSADDPELRAACCASIMRFESAIARAISLEHRDARQADCERAAQGIASLYFNAISLLPLDLPENWFAFGKTNALILLQQLEATT